MEKIKRILFKFLFPHTAIIALLALIAAFMLIYALTCDNVNPIVAYLSYILSAYSLTILCVKSSIIFRKAKTVKQENKYLNRYLGDVVLRIKLSLYGSLIINTLYAIMQLSLGFYNRSVWFYALSGYYFLLALIRLFLLKELRKNRLGKNLRFEYLHYRFCGVILLFMNIALSVIVFYIVNQNKGFSHHYIMTIAMAAYTFFTFTVAIVNLVRYRKYHNPVISASKAVNLAAAFVSMLSLETAMLTAFGKENSPVFRKTITASTGTAVCILILSMAIYMIIHSTKQLHQMKKEASNNE